MYMYYDAKEYHKYLLNLKSLRACIELQLHPNRIELNHDYWKMYCKILFHAQINILMDDWFQPLFCLLQWAVQTSYTTYSSIAEMLMHRTWDQELSSNAGLPWSYEMKFYIGRLAGGKSFIRLTFKVINQESADLEKKLTPIRIYCKTYHGTSFVWDISFETYF